MKSAPNLTRFLWGIAFFPTLFIATSATAQYKPWLSPSAAQHLTNPLKGNPAVLPDAQKLYLSTCSPCHGNKGKGDGAAAAALNPKPADHTSASVQAETDGSLFWKISEGRSPMPTYKTVLTENQRWELVDYIRTLAAKGKK